MKLLLTGATGFIGSNLCPMLLKEGHELAILTRSPERYKDSSADNQRFISWDSDLVEEMERADGVINLAGENLFHLRWTQKIKRSLYESRIETTRTLIRAISRAENRPELLISASGISYYGDRGDTELDETYPPGDDFLARLCTDWEEEALKAEPLGVRVAIPRIGIVFEPEGGMLKTVKRPFLLFVGGPIGHGKQYLAWIHMDDICRTFLHAIRTESLVGAYNVCSPNPVTMDEFASLMGKILNRPSFFRVPTPLLKLVMGEASEPALGSLRATPKRLLETGFDFEFEDPEEALADLL